jgi:hypothetical protein
MTLNLDLDWFGIGWLRIPPMVMIIFYVGMK